MQRNFLRGLLVCLIPCLLAGLFAIQIDKYRLGVDLAGGTILVYEINLQRTQDRKNAAAQSTGEKVQPAAASGLDPREMNELAAQIKRRIDPTDIKNVTVRPLGDRRLEIILPTSGAAGGKANLTAEEIGETKRLISQMGVLEFRILANGADDKEGIAVARPLVEALSPDDQKRLAEDGKAPAGPAEPFSVKINDVDSKVTYLWAELGPEERESLGLSNKFENQPGLWTAAKTARDANKTFAVRSGPNGYEATSDTAAATMVLYSRESTNKIQAAKEEAERQQLIRDGKTPEEADKLVDRKKVEYFVLTRRSPEDSVRVGDEGVTLSATAGTDKNFSPCVEFTFNSVGGNKFGKITTRNKPSNNTTRHLAILLDDRVVSAPAIQSVITNHGQITGKFDRKTVERQVHILRSGALSAELTEKPVSESAIASTLGEDTIRKGTRAIGLAFLSILLFMLAYYRFAGLVACIALMANLLLTVGFMVAVNAAFTLPGLAGLVLTLGMAVDANVLIYERLREERNKGANLVTAIRNGYDRAFLTIIDTHLTSIFTAIVLYTFGNDQLKGFAISLTVGLIISLFTSLYMTRLMFDFWLHKKWLTELKMLRLFGRLQFNPMKYRYVFFPLTAVLTVLGIGLFLARGDSVLNVDFRGGTVIGGRLKPGEERALTKTADGALGFRELLSEERQQERLRATSAKWENEPVIPSGDDRTTLTPAEIAGVKQTGYVYTITYDDGNNRTSTATVTLTEAPNGAARGDVAAMAADVVARASHLPDVSVEQTFELDQSFPDGKSQMFTIRTTERQPELVRVNLNRLLRSDAGTESLMDLVTMTYDAPVGPKAVLKFTKHTSPSYVKELITRELKKKLLTDSALLFKLEGRNGTEDHGRFTEMDLDFSDNSALSKLKDVGVPDTDPDRAAKLALVRDVLAEVKKAIDAAPVPDRLEVFDSQLASETRTKASYAIVASWIAILLYLWFRFGNWTFGLAAVICLVHDLCFTLGAIAICHYLFALPGANIFLLEDFKIDLAAVAALLTLVGYSVNEIIVNFARIREVRGKNPLLTPTMINDSVNQTLSRTILTSMTVLLVSLVLYFFGGEGVHLFAFVMVMGVLISTYSSIFVASPLLLFLGEGRDAAAEAAAFDPDAKLREETADEVVEG